MFAYYPPGWESLQSRIVGRWCPSFTGATGLQLPDTMGRNHGVLTNMEANAYVVSGGKASLNFVASNNAILTNPVVLGTVHTSSAWVFNNDAAAFNFNGLNGDNTSSNLCSLAFTATGSTSNIVTFAYSYLATAVTASVPNVYQKWVHAVTVRSGQFVEFYLDGSFVGSGTGSGMGSFSPDRIGQRQMGAVWYRGLIDDVIYFNTALTANEVRFLYEQGRGGGMLLQPPRRRSFLVSAGFKAYWARRRSQIIGAGNVSS
ncbi:MAG: hypothetical protein EBR82_87115 [Caulobacteraceae bacterium]|nr:hypothetical protein [Caulobacteraceae bacterium]